MAIVQKQRDEEQYGRLMGMMAPQAAPTKRVGTDAPIGAAAGGQSAGKGPQEFTQVTAASPGSVFKRQAEGANIAGIRGLAEKPLAREAAAEAGRVVQEGLAYKQQQAEERKKQPQFADFTKAITDIGKGDAGATKTAQEILQGYRPEVAELQIGDIREFTPMKAVRGGSVEGMLRQEARGPYSTGMAGLDALLFQKRGGTKALGEKAAAIRAAEQKTADLLEQSATKEAREASEKLGTEQKTGFQGALKAGIGTRRADYQTALDKAVADRNAQLAESLKATQTTAQNKAIQEVTSQFGLTLTPEQDAQLRAAMASADQTAAGLFAPPTQQATLADIATPEQAAEYGRLVDLLGLGGADVSEYSLGKKTSALAAPMAALSAEQLGMGERRNVDLMNAYREAAMKGIQPVVAGQPFDLPTYTRDVAEGRDPTMREFKEPKEKEFIDISGPYGRYA